MTIRKDEARAIFDRAVEHTRGLSPASFDQWFGGVQFDDLTDGVLTLRVQNEFVLEWVKNNYLPTLTEKIRALSAWSVQIAWTIDPHLDAPVSARTHAHPVRPRALVVRSSTNGANGGAPALATAARSPSTPPDEPAVHSGSNISKADGRVEAPSALVNDGRDALEPPVNEQRDAPQLPRADAAVPNPGGAEPRRPDLRPPPEPMPVVRRVASPPDGLNPKHSFANFVVGPSNQLAHAAAIAAAGGGGRRYNPLFICGGTGLGKTHLVHSIAQRIYAERPEARIIYVSAERFTNDFIGALQHKKMDEFRARYRSLCDVLLVDDIQFLAGRDGTQEEFFHTFNALHTSDRQIVVTSDKYPQQLQRMEERLVSRFSWGLVADIQVPELETRVAIVRNKAAIEGIEMDDDVAVYLAQTIRSNVRELEGTLIRLAAKSSLTGRPVDMAFARSELQASASVARASSSVEDIQRAVCHHFQLRSTDLTSKDRHKSVAFARHVAMYLCKQRLKCSFPEIGRAFGNRDHTTVMSAVRKIEAQRDSDPQVRAHLEALERKLADE